ncbi:hypothetical protein [Exiguobacterium sp. s142]|uniref:hypothetical protein n=1 Tax=Exiguobacterium sp. s142 TaxID=2751222 RepID=UPI001BED174B|nr:hypothetical protein [Exiguobacterium sp. s142]
MNTPTRLLVVLRLILLVWIGVSLTLPSKLYAGSSDGQWEAEYDVGNSIKNIWRGQLYWDGMKGDITALDFYRDGQLLTGDLDWSPHEYIDLAATDQTEFIYFGEVPTDSSEYTLRIKWRNEGEEFEQVLSFKDKKRFFVIPKLG